MQLPGFSWCQDVNERLSPRFCSGKQIQNCCPILLLSIYKYVQHWFRGQKQILQRRVLFKSHHYVIKFLAFYKIHYQWVVSLTQNNAFSFFDLIEVTGPVRPVFSYECVCTVCVHLQFSSQLFFLHIADSASLVPHDSIPVVRANFS